jgi:hypothetical protein
MVTLVAGWSFGAGSLHDWLVVIKAFSLWAAVCVVLGSVIGYLCRGRIALALPLSFIASLAFCVYLVWTSPMRPQEWSWQYPIESFMYLIGPFLYAFFAPATLAAVLVGRWSQRRRVRSDETI